MAGVFDRFGVSLVSSVLAGDRYHNGLFIVWEYMFVLIWSGLTYNTDFCTYGRKVVHYIDNESVRLALLRGSGEISVAKHVAARIMDSECYLGKKSWYARVSSASNLADDPSVETFIL